MRSMTSSEVTLHRTALLKFALHYARRGWPVFPLHTVEENHCSCGRECGRNAGKHPRTERGLLNATTDLNRIRTWWATWPDANLGIPTGTSTFVVLDVDPEKGGDTTLAALLAQHGPLPETVEAFTGGGGRHLCFQHPGGRFPNSASVLGPGLDTRGDGGYIVAAPSAIAPASGTSGICPRIPITCRSPLCPPGSVGDSLRRRMGTTASHAEPVDEIIPEGARNARLASLAGTMRRRGMTVEEIVDALRSVNRRRCVPPLQADGSGRSPSRSDGMRRPSRVRSLRRRSTTRSPAARHRARGVSGPDVPAARAHRGGLLYTDGGGWIGGEEKLGQILLRRRGGAEDRVGAPGVRALPVPQRRRGVLHRGGRSPASAPCARQRAPPRQGARPDRPGAPRRSRHVDAPGGVDGLPLRRARARRATGRRRAAPSSPR